MQRRPDVVMRKRRTCDEKSCCCSCRPSLRSQERTVLSRPPVHSFEPSEEMSMHDAPSVCPWNCLTNVWLCKSHTAMLPSEQQLKQTCGDGAKKKKNDIDYILIIIGRPTRKIDHCRRPTSVAMLLLCARKYLGVRTDGQCVARRRAGRELGFYSRCRRGQIPYAQVTGFSAYDERPAVRQQFYRSYIVITLLQSKKLSCH